jgi:hypothetical protein
MQIGYDPSNWYWIVAGDETQVYSSARTAMVAIAETTYQTWLSSGGMPTCIDTMDNLIEVLRAVNVPPYHQVPTRIIVDRLEAAGKLEAARAALDAAPLYTRERWNNRQLVNADDPDANALLQVIGADPAVILAPI